MLSCLGFLVALDAIGFKAKGSETPAFYYEEANGCLLKLLGSITFDTIVELTEVIVELVLLDREVV